MYTIPAINRIFAGMKPDISVLIPVYNVERYLARCLDSVLSQDVASMEIICVDDCSPDGSASILADYAQRYDNIRILRHERNMGLMQARKTGYLAATGRYLCFCDSDDMLPQGSLGVLLSTATASGADMTVGDIEVVNPRGQRRVVQRHGRVGTDYRSYLRSILTGGSTPLMGILFRSGLFSAPGYEALPHQSISEDRLLITEMALARHPSVCSADVIAYSYMLQEASLTQSRPSEQRALEQLKALERNQVRIETVEPTLAPVSRYFVTRYLSWLIEQGSDRHLLAGFSDRMGQLLRFGEMRANMGLRLAVHTWLAMYVPGYASAAYAARKAVRRMQGK